MKMFISILFILASLSCFAQINQKFINTDDLFEYKTECYNDSTEEFYYYMCDWDCVKIYCSKEDVGNNILSQCKSHWTHKQPTFEGFIVWLEKKYKN